MPRRCHARPDDEGDLPGNDAAHDRVRQDVRNARCAWRPRVADEANLIPRCGYRRNCAEHDHAGVGIRVCRRVSPLGPDRGWQSAGDETGEPHGEGDVREPTALHDQRPPSSRRLPSSEGRQETELLDPFADELADVDVTRVVEDDAEDPVELALAAPGLPPRRQHLPLAVKDLHPVVAELRDIDLTLLVYGIGVLGSAWQIGLGIQAAWTSAFVNAAVLVCASTRVVRRSYGKAA